VRILVLTGKDHQMGRHARQVISIMSCGLALLLVAACEHASHRPAKRPVMAECGGADPVPAYGDHLSYPPGDPVQPPPSKPIVGCFASLGQAEARGFPAAAPRGTVIVDGVFLEPTGRVTLRQCRATARRLGFAVPCPAVAPATSPRAPSCSDGGGCLTGSWFTFEEYGFYVPPGYRGVSGQAIGHFVLLAARTGPGTGLIVCRHRLPVIREVTVEGARAQIVHCTAPGTYTSGHVILRWVHRGVLVGVSFHGFTATNIALDLAVAHHLVWISSRR
jgi:hypothetical protein